jgi:uncharacterized protein YcbK (DUF882 family)
MTTEYHPPTPDDIAAIALTLCEQYGASVTSWYRTPRRNRAVGGHPSSLHLKGLAVDLVADDPSAHPTIAAHARRLGLVAIQEEDHVHIQARRLEHP